MSDIFDYKLVFAGMSDNSVNMMEMMSSQRYRKRPSSRMFKELFKYIAGVNKVER